MELHQDTWGLQICHQDLVEDSHRYPLLVCKSAAIFPILGHGATMFPSRCTWLPPLPNCS